MKKVSESFSYGGKQLVYSHHSSVNDCEMTFAIFLPPIEKKAPVLWYLSGLTCSYQNVMEKGEYRKKAAELGMVLICPDTSPRGDNVPDEKDNWQFGSGAGFYLDATVAPYNTNYNMYTYITKELPKLIEENFDFDMSRQSIFGHSMGGHGALVIALRNSTKYKSCSAFAPIVEPISASWSSEAFKKYIGPDRFAWELYDSVSLVKNGYVFPEILIDQGEADDFLNEGLKPWLFSEACNNSSINLQLRMQPNYDHSYYFISTFMEEHLVWHRERI
ncbi:S-formylglutathione hydrolase [Alphaproteobacteria bacterium]|jgi:S-formylglutathione hydrolase|nr:S-formylglutathione hydrolase [Alphaproteobacteria bacterium]|tara:strand:+ start:198 stop:1022 length:825 start_codon:yes stop_codon:yes gene_type:complete